MCGHYMTCAVCYAKTQLLLRALNKLAAFDDSGANHHLKITGKYSGFDEPESVKEAREALKAYREAS